MHTNNWLISGLLALALALVGCDSLASGSPTTLSQRITLDLTTDAFITAPGETLTLAYPDGWFASGEGGQITLTNVAGVDLLADTIAPGQAFLNIQPLDVGLANTLGADPINPDAPVNALTILNGFTQSMINLGQSMSFNEAEMLPMNGDDAALLIATSAAGDAVIITRRTETALYMGVGATAAGEGQTFRDIFVAIVASATLE